MWHIVVWNSRLTNPLVLRYRKDNALTAAWEYISTIRSGKLSMEDDCGNTICMDAADLAGCQRVDTARDMDAKVEEAVAQHKAQERAQRQAQGLGGLTIPRQGMM